MISVDCVGIVILGLYNEFNFFLLIILFLYIIVYLFLGIVSLVGIEWVLSVMIMLF